MAAATVPTSRNAYPVGVASITMSPPELGVPSRSTRPSHSRAGTVPPQWLRATRRPAKTNGAFAIANSTLTGALTPNSRTGTRNAPHSAHSTVNTSTSRYDRTASALLSASLPAQPAGPGQPTAATVAQHHQPSDELRFGLGDLHPLQQTMQQLVVPGLGHPQLRLYSGTDPALQMMVSGEHQHRPVLSI